MVGDTGGARGLVEICEVPRRAEMVVEGPDDVAGAGEASDLLVGEDLVDGGPQR
jgi:hypothetical protein